MLQEGPRIVSRQLVLYVFSVMLIDRDVQSVLAQAECLFASFSNFYFTNYNIKLDYIYS